MKLLLPLLLALFGLGGGLAGGFALKPPPEAKNHEDGGGGEHDQAKADPGAEGDHAPGEAVERPLTAHPKKPNGEPANAEYVKLDRQFVVPIITDKRVEALIVLSMALQVTDGAADTVFAHEPRLRDELLQALFRHSESGGFSGAFTSSHVMDDLRASLIVAARDVLGDLAISVLLTNIVRQDL